MTAPSDARSAAFEFGRRLGDAEFRQSLPRTLRKHQNVLVVVETDKVHGVLERALTQTRPPVLIAILRSSETFEFLNLRLSLRGLVTMFLDRPRPIPAIHPDMTIGAFCDGLREARHKTQANEWVKVKHVGARTAHAH